MTEPYPFPTSADEFADKRVLVTGDTCGIGPRPKHAAKGGLAGAVRVATLKYPHLPRSIPKHPAHSHSIVPSGLLVMSWVIQFMPRSSLTMRLVAGLRSTPITAFE